VKDRQTDKIYDKAIKIASAQMNYKAGPLMEEKLVKMIRKRKIISAIYKIGALAVIVLAVFLIGSEKLSIAKVHSPSVASETLNSSELSVESADNASNVQQPNTANSSEDEQDPFFKMMKYVSIASDGNWLTGW